MAQEATKITEKVVEISTIEESALHVKIHRASLKDIQKEFKRELKKRSKNIESNGKEIIASAALFPGISSQEIKVFALIEELNNFEHELKVIFLNGETPITAAKNPSGYIAAEKFLHDFANKLSINANADYLKSETKLLKSNQKDLKKLNKKVSKAEKNIKKAESNIKKNHKLYESLKAEENLDIKGINKKANAEKSVVYDKEKIKTLKEEIAELEKSIKKKKMDISKQEEVVEKAKKAYNVFK